MWLAYKEAAASIQEIGRHPLVYLCRTSQLCSSFKIMVCVTLWFSFSSELPIASCSKSFWEAGRAPAGLCSRHYSSAVHRCFLNPPYPKYDKHKSKIEAKLTIQGLSIWLCGLGQRNI